MKQTTQPKTFFNQVWHCLSTAVILTQISSLWRFQHVLQSNIYYTALTNLPNPKPNITTNLEVDHSNHLTLPGLLTFSFIVYWSRKLFTSKIGQQYTITITRLPYPHQCHLPDMLLLWERLWWLKSENLTIFAMK